MTSISPWRGRACCGGLRVVREGWRCDVCDHPGLHRHDPSPYAIGLEQLGCLHRDRQLRAGAYQNDVGIRASGRLAPKSMAADPKIRTLLAAALGSFALFAAVPANAAALTVNITTATEADGLPAPPGWWRHVAGDLPALASVLTHLGWLDADFPDQLLSVAQDAAGTDLWFAGLHAEAMLAVLRRDEARAVERLRDALTQRERNPCDREPSTGHACIPPLVALDLGRLYLALGRGTNAAVIGETVTTRTPASALLDCRIRLAQGRPEDALLAINGIGNLGAAAGARLEAHLLAAEALAVTGRDEAGFRHELARAVAMSDEVGSVLPFWWASPGVLRSAARIAPERLLPG
jgi:LuxR family transcriptional regulator, maltose regulon positive regulatory protein